MSESIPGHKHSSHSRSGGANLKRKRQNSTASQTSSEPTVCFHVGNESRETSQGSLLSYIWNTGLDSSCVSCGEPFQPSKDVPIRTIGLERNSPLRPSVIDITQDPISPWNLRIFNQHFACIKTNKVNYIPISHAWHESVAAAHDTRTESISVARIVYQTPLKTLLALAEVSPDCEIWHDYISVPQWRADIQKQLLLSIPEIYNYATKTAIHLDDVKSVHITNQAKSSPYNRFIVDFTTIIKSRWFDRMWVALEYILSKDVVILTEDYMVCEHNARDLCLRLDALHSKWVKQRGNSDVTEEIWKQNTTLKRMNSWIDMEAWKNEKGMYRTLGWAIGILGHRQCRRSRDYLLALGKMLDFVPTKDPLILVEDRFQYFLSLATHALLLGDYTPLLFIPPSAEKRDDRAPWLRGYSAAGWKV
ncbi:unnamed protein product [Clonostachys chloroleuca]|uniref:Heterokaryon incompatibility domain-containing protein n=1 Tax=Clonostachys chloroleuca TaxID=1926264 RepID=A0AA35M5J6_9HYPO|nr:unnamed protein product [Clonostachys chloroleuca]